MNPVFKNFLSVLPDAFIFLNEWRSDNIHINNRCFDEKVRFFYYYLALLKALL